MFHGGEMKTVYGISQNCFDTFSIPSSLVYGNSTNELTLETIMPEINNLEEEQLKNPNGFMITIDSTLLKQNYDFGENESENESEEHKSEEE